MSDKLLSGCRILILEDDFYQAHDSRETLELAGATVISVGGTPPDLAALRAEGRVDGAVIDINLGQEMSFDFARKLHEHAIPFLFVTGYDASVLPDDLAGAACISKPAPGERIVEELARLLAEAPDSRNSAG